MSHFRGLRLGAEFLELLSAEQSTDRTYNDILREIVRSTVKVWSGDPIIERYTDHGPAHSDRVLGRIEEISSHLIRPLKPYEAFVLSAGAYLHDIGMKCDAKHPAMKRVVKTAIAEAKHRGYNPARRLSKEDGYSKSDQLFIRDLHGCLTYSMLMHMAENPSSVPCSPDHTYIQGLESEVLDIGLVCMYHTKLKFGRLEEGFVGGDGDPRLVASMLRFADELDIDRRRVDPLYFKPTQYPVENLYHWDLHRRTKLSYEEGSYKLELFINPRDHAEFGKYLDDHYIQAFIKKNRETLKVLKDEQKCMVSLDALSSVVPRKGIRPIPKFIAEYIRQEINRVELQDQSPGSAERSGKQSTGGLAQVRIKPIPPTLESEQDARTLSQEEAEEGGDTSSSAAPEIRLALALAEEFLRNSEATWETLSLAERWRTFGECVIRLKSQSAATLETVFNEVDHYRLAVDVARSGIGLLRFIASLRRNYEANNWSLDYPSEEFFEAASRRLSAILQHRTTLAADKAEGVSSAVAGLTSELVNTYTYCADMPTLLADPRMSEMIDTIADFHLSTSYKLKDLAKRRVSGAVEALAPFAPSGKRGSLAELSTNPRLAVILDIISRNLPHNGPNQTAPDIWSRR